MGSGTWIGSRKESSCNNHPCTDTHMHEQLQVDGYRVLSDSLSGSK